MLAQGSYWIQPIILCPLNRRTFATLQVLPSHCCSLSTALSLSVFHSFILRPSQWGSAQETLLIPLTMVKERGEAVTFKAHHGLGLIPAFSLMLCHNSYVDLIRGFCRDCPANRQDQKLPVHMLSLLWLPPYRAACLMKSGRLPFSWYSANYAKMNYSGGLFYTDNRAAA